MAEEPKPGQSTYRVAEQTNRCGRFARVTVLAITANDLVVDIVDGAGANDAWRREAEFGAEYAIKHGHDTGKAHVTVAEIMGTEVDTLPGTVFEATARAVWQALGVAQEHRSAAMSHRELVHPILAMLCGRLLEKVIEARHWYEGRRGGDQESLIHLWLYFEHCPPIVVHSCGEHVELSYTRPYPPYSMDEFGETKVDVAGYPDLLASFVGATLLSTLTLHWDTSTDECSALMLRFDAGDLVVGSLADEWVISQQVPHHAAEYWTSTL